MRICHLTGCIDSLIAARHAMLLSGRLANSTRTIPISSVSSPTVRGMTGGMRWIALEWRGCWNGV